MVDIKTQFVSDSIANKRTYGRGNKKKWIVIHQTGNRNRGANAQAHANIQSRLNPRQASWHFSVDDKEAIQSFSADYHCWHAGVGKAEGNLNAIAIELCINSDADYKKTIENGAELTKWLMDKYNIPIENVTQHWDWSRKNCPAQLRANEKGINWNDFLNMVQGNKPKVAVKGAIKVKAPVRQKGEYAGNSIVDYLASIGEDSSFNNRKSLAKEYGISGYTGTAAQNLELLERMREGAVVEDVAEKSSQTTNTNWTSVVDYLNATGQDSSFSNRARLAKKHGISNYRGTAAQNIELLNKLAGGSTAAKAKPKKTKSSTVNIESIAQQIKKGIDNKGRRIPNGHSARRKHFGLTQSQYDQVRNRVNQIM